MKKIFCIILVALLAVCFVGCSSKGSNAKEIKTKDGQKYTIKPTEASQIKFTDYSDPEGRFTAQIPEGYEVSTTVLPDMMFGIDFYKPDEKTGPKYHAFLILKIELMYSPEMKAFQVNTFGGFELYNMLTEAVAIDSPTVAAMFSKFNDIMNYNKKYELGYDTFITPQLNNFTPIEEFPLNSSMASVALDDKIVRATFDNVFDGSLQQGLFSGTLVTNVLGAGSYSAYNVMGICAPDTDFPEYEPILNKILSSVSFSDSFVSQIMSSTQESYDTARQIGAELAAASQAYNDAWFKRQESYDIISQKQSDATLGYERVYNTDTGEIYKATNGFTDVYDGALYKPITDDMYTSPIAGYIE